MSEEKRSLTGAGLEILGMWERQNPQMVENLKKSGELRDVLIDRQELVADVVQDLIMGGMQYHSALEIGREMMQAPPDRGG